MVKRFDGRSRTQLVSTTNGFRTRVVATRDGVRIGEGNASTAYGAYIATRVDPSILARVGVTRRVGA